jgi:hypothetical protein
MMKKYIFIAFLILNFYCSLNNAKEREDNCKKTDAILLSGLLGLSDPNANNYEKGRYQQRIEYGAMVKYDCLQKE